ncbi:hypothetical protein M422DRAFT_156393, partial [Sphaerobolus stellatus SS14]
PSPFPRYGHSVPMTSTANGELYLFGGLVHESLQSDMYLISIRDLAATLLHTAGDVPSPRVGHSCTLIGSALIVWGGDKDDVEINKSPDGAVYFFNTVTREWTNFETTGRTPVGRYGHSATMVGKTFFVFGGQFEANFFNDLWAFDLNNIQSGKPSWEQCLPTDGVAPAARTGHICVTYDDRIYMYV